MTGLILKALVVDDDPVARRMVSAALGYEGFVCSHAVNGQKALHSLSSESFDLVVSDLRMPERHGHSLVVELLRRDQAPAIVIHSNLDDPALTRDLLSRGVDDVICKPTNYATFAVKMKSLVRRRKNAVSPQTEPHPAMQAAAETSDTANSNLRPAGIRIDQLEYEQRLSTVQHLLPLSSTATNVFFMSKNRETETSDLVQTMIQDAALTAEVLRLANSAYYNRSARPTVNIEEAVVRIGFRKIGEVALALKALASLRNTVLPWFDADLNQTRSFAATIAIEHLIEASGRLADDDGLTLCAFLHPLGRLLVGTAFSAEYAALIHEAETKRISLVDLEKTIFPEHHSAALSRFLMQWELPESICQPLALTDLSYQDIATLDDPLRTRVELVKLAIFCGELAVGRWMSWDSLEPPSRQVLRRHHLPGLASLIEQVRDDLQRMPAIETNKAASSITSHHGETKDRPKRHVVILDQSAGDADWLPVLLDSMGIQAVAHNHPDANLDDGVVICGMFANEQDISRLASLHRKFHPVLIIDHQTSLPDDLSATILQLPVSFSEIQTAMLP